MRKGEIQLQPLDVNEVTNEVLRLAHSEISAHQRDGHRQLTPDLPAVWGDRVGLQQVLLNLIVNACDAMKLNEPARRHLTVTTALDGEGAVEVAIADCGGGIPAEQSSGCSSRSSRPRSTGWGWGLAICRSIVAAHGGRLWVTNNGDRGATFCFALAAQSGDEP